MLTNVSIADLHRMDYGAHIHLLEEWNEDTEFAFQPASVMLHGFYTRVIHEDGLDGLIVATYVSNGEGELVSFYIWSHHRPQGYEYVGTTLHAHCATMRVDPVIHSAHLGLS